MDKIGIEVMGTAEAAEFFQTLLPNQVRNLARQTVQSIAQGIAKEIRESAKFPTKRTGRLRRSFRARRRNQRGSRTLFVSDAIFLNGRTDGFYWRFLEHGASHGIMAHDFVEPVYLRYKVANPQLWAEHFSRKLEKMRARQSSRMGAKR